MKKPGDNLTTAQFADILGLTARRIRGLSTAGEIPSKIINGRGDRRFSISEVLASETTPKQYKDILYLWVQNQIQGQPTLNGAETLPARIDAITRQPVSPDNTDPWLNLPESCRDKGYRLYQLVEGARNIRDSVKKGQGRTKALTKYGKKRGVPYTTLQNHIKRADKALAAAIKDNASDIITPQIKALSPRYGGNRNNFHSWSAPALNFAIDKYLEQSCPNITDVYRLVEAAAVLNPDWKIGSYESLVDAIGRIDESTKMLARQGKRKFEAARVSKILRDFEEIPPNFMWVGDHHILDVFVKVPDSKGGWHYQRPWITAWMDMRSRSLMGWVITFKPNSQSIAMALAHAISEKNDPNFPQHGLAYSVLIDNGKDYRSKLLNGETVDFGTIDYPEIIEKYAALGIDPFYIDLQYDPEEEIWKKKRGKKEIVVKGVRVGGVYASLGISSCYAIAYHPWAKLIERFFRNVVQSFSRNLPGWCGSTTDQRPEKLAAELKNGQLLTFEELTAQFYDYITNVYHKTPHRGHGMNGRTPDEVFQELLPQPKKVGPELLDFALAKKERVKIHSWGFQINNRKFQLDIPSDLYGGSIANRLIGEWARVCYDYDFKTVRVFKDGRFVCNAKRLQRASFVDPDCPVMIDGLRLQAHQRKAANATLKAIHGQALVDMPVSESQALLNLTVGHSIPAPEYMSESNAEPASIEEYIPVEPVERYEQILSKIKDGREISESDREFRAEYEKTEEYQSYQHLFTGTMG